MRMLMNDLSLPPNQWAWRFPKHASLLASSRTKHATHHSNPRAMAVGHLPRPSLVGAGLDPSRRESDQPPLEGGFLLARADKSGANDPAPDRPSQSTPLGRFAQGFRSRPRWR